MPIVWEHKAQYIDDALRGSVYRSCEEDRQRVFRKRGGTITPVDEVEIQRLIDTYNPLPLERRRAKKRVLQEFEDTLENLESRYPASEKRLFWKMEQEARAYLADNTAETPVLTIIARERLRSVTQIANRVIARADAQAAQIAELVGKRHRAEDRIDASNDPDEIRGIGLHG